MISLPILVLGGGSNNSNFSPVPLPVYIEGKWRSTVKISAGVYDSDPVAAQVSHTSEDNGLNYVLTGVDHNTSLPNGLPTTSITNIIARKQGIWVQYKVGDNNWQEQSLSSIPGGSFGGGTLIGIYSDNVNNEFIVHKKGGSGGDDVFTTPDFINWEKTSNDVNPLTVVENNLFENIIAVYYIGSQYIAYGTTIADNTKYRTATSTDLDNWIMSGSDLSMSSGPFAQMVKFGTRYFIFIRTGSTIPTYVLEIWSSTDALTWTQATLPTPPANLGMEGKEWLITSTSLELITLSHVYKTTDGVNWSMNILQNNLRPGGRFGTISAFAKGNPIDTDAGPTHIAVPNVKSLQLGGKILSLSEVNASAALQYPGTTTYGALTGFLENTNSAGKIKEEGFLFDNQGNSSSHVIQSFYARNTATTRYFEVTLTVKEGTLKIGAVVLGDEYVSNRLTSGVVSAFHLTDSLITTSNVTDDAAVTHTHTTGQVIGFLFNFVSATCVINVDGTDLSTVSGLVNTLSWVIDIEAINGGKYHLNVGQEAFINNGTGATSWMTS